MRSNDEIPEEILRLCLYYGKITLYIINFQKQVVWIRKWLARGSGINGRNSII